MHFDTISLAQYADLFANTHRVLDHHNVESNMMLRRASLEKNWLKRLYFGIEGRKLEKYEEYQCVKFACNMMCSDLDADRLREVCGNVATQTIPNGVDLDYFSSKSESRVPAKLIFVGRLSAYANAQAARFLATEIWPALAELVPHASLDIVGSSPPPEVVALAKSDNSIRAHGFVDDMRPLVDKASIYVCPIFDGGGTKLKILDAMAMQLPIVATPIACEGINLRDGESVLFAETAGQFANAIKTLVDDDALRIRISENAYEIVRDGYSYDSIGESMNKLFTDLVSCTTPQSSVSTD